MTVYYARRRPRAVALVAKAVGLMSLWAALAVVGVGAFLFTLGWGAR